MKKKIREIDVKTYYKFTTVKKYDTGTRINRGFLNGTAGKESACNAGDTGNVSWTTGLGRSPGGGNGNPVQYSCLENPLDRGAWWYTVQGIARSQTQLRS